MENSNISSKLTSVASDGNALLTGDNVSFLLNQPKNEFLATLLLSAFQSEAKQPRKKDGLTAPSVDRGFKVFDVQAAETQWAKKSGGKSQEINQLQLEILRDMSSDDGRRVLVEMSEPSWSTELRSRFPHFEEVISFVERSLAVSACGEEGAPFKLPPILLRGSPGVGKTYFAQELARLAGTEFFERDLSILSESFVLTGLDPSWKGAKPGLVFDALVRSKIANPLILLNEVDKLSTSSQRSSPLSAMYALLEPTSSSTFVDEFIPVPIDASAIAWILTANDGEVPPAILSRLEVFDIPVPSEKQMMRVAASVWRSVCSRHLPKGHPFDPTLPQDILARFATSDPRAMRKAMVNATGVCLLSGRHQLSHDILDRVFERKAKARQAIGFV